jgi:hypothetical protein
MFIKIETYIPFRSESEEMDSLAKELISLLLDVSDEIFLPLDDFGIASLNISKVDSNDIIKLKDIYPTHFTSEILELMHFKSEIDFELIYEFNHEALPDFVTNETMNSSYLTGIYRSRLVNFLIFSQLAIPGSLYTYKGFFLVDEKFHMDINPFSSSLIGGLAYEEKSNWPFIRKLPIIKVWDYIVNQTQILTTSSSNNIENMMKRIILLPIYFGLCLVLKHSMQKERLELDIKLTKSQKYF